MQKFNPPLKPGGFVGDPPKLRVVYLGVNARGGPFIALAGDEQAPLCLLVFKDVDPADIGCAAKPLQDGPDALFEAVGSEKLLGSKANGFEDGIAAQEGIFNLLAVGDVFQHT